MTGFGAAVAESGAACLQVHVRSVNHRFLEVKARLPRELSALEPELPGRLRAMVERGHVEVVVTGDVGAGLRFDRVAAERLLAEARRLGEALGLRDDLSLSGLLALPGVLALVDEGGHAPLCAAVLDAVDRAARALVAMRTEEGARLAEDLERRVQQLSGCATAIAARVPAWAAERRLALRQRVEGLRGSLRLDPTMLEHELVAAAERGDISEELVRIGAHLAAVRSELQKPDGRGKKLEFLTQELLREFNTIGSKSQDTQITHSVVEAKCEIERIREQVSNLE